MSPVPLDLSGLPPIQNDLIDGSPPSSRAQLLYSLLEKNHGEHSLLLQRVIHNHLPHQLTTLYLLNAPEAKLSSAYTHESASLEPRPKSGPSAINNEQELRAHLGDLDYQSPFLTYYTNLLNQITTTGDPTTKATTTLIHHSLLSSSPPLLHGLPGGFAHPLILLSDSLETASPLLTLEALSLNALDFNALHKILSLPYTAPAPGTGLSPAQIIEQIGNDPRFDGMLDKPGVQNTGTILSHPGMAKAVLEYVNWLEIAGVRAVDVVALLAEVGVGCLCGGHVPPTSDDGKGGGGGEVAFDFYLNHILTFAYSLRVVISRLPFFAGEGREATEYRIALVRGIWVLVVITYVAQLRPRITRALIDDVELHLNLNVDDETGLDVAWEDMFKEVREEGPLKGKWEDAHFTRAIKNLRELGRLGNDNRSKEEASRREMWYLKAATKLTREWNGWTGFGKEGEVKLNVRL